MNHTHSYSYEQFLEQHSESLLNSTVPAIFWPTLYSKLLNEEFNISDIVRLSKVVYKNGDSEWSCRSKEGKILSTDAENIYLVDHAWSFKLENIENNLNTISGLAERVSNIMSIHKCMCKSELIEKIKKNIWKYARVYTVSLPDPSNPNQPPESSTIWYLNDEVGSAIQHSDSPNFRMIPFFYLPRSICYSILWPIDNINSDEEITIDYVSHVKPDLRKCKLYPWFDEDFSKDTSIRLYCQKEAFFAAHMLDFSDLNKISLSERVNDLKLIDVNRRLKVYTDMPFVAINLVNCPNFIVVDNKENADIWWLYSDVKSSIPFLKSQQINQFIGEKVLTVKDLLAALASDPEIIDLTGPGPELDITGRPLTSSWYPLTFNLVHELPQFLAHYQRMEKEINGSQNSTPCSENCLRRSFSYYKDSEIKRKNVWICKPWNMGRGKEIVITESAEQIVAMSNGLPLIASRYICDPLLFHRKDLDMNVKFDIRYVVCVKSAKPLNIFVHRVFWLRFANEEYCLSDWNKYNKHFTVMNYRNDYQLKQIHHDEFIRQFEVQYPKLKWEEIELKIFTMIRNLFKASVHFDFPKGLKQLSNSRAMYALDLMLEWKRANSGCHSIEPQICEVNFTPDCTRACQFYPDFFKQIFTCLFLPDSDFQNSPYYEKFIKL